MTKSNIKLYAGSKSAGRKDDEITLYTSLADVQNEGKLFKFNGENLYAKYGEISHPQASKVRIKNNGVEKALLRQARIVWNFDDVKLRYKEGSSSASSTNMSLIGRYSGPTNDTYTDAEFQWDVSIPAGATNIVVKWDWETQNKPVVNLDWFNRKLTLNSSSEATTGHYEFTLSPGSNWDNRVTVSSYDAGIFNKYLYIRNFSIEMDINVPIIEYKYIDNFSNIRQIDVNSDSYNATVQNGHLSLSSTNIQDQPYFIYNMGLTQGFDTKFSFEIGSLTAGCQLRLRVVYYTEERILDYTTNGVKTIDLKPYPQSVKFSLMLVSGTPTSINAQISNVTYRTYWAD